MPTTTKAANKNRLTFRRNAIRLAKQVILLTDCDVNKAARVVELFAANNPYPVYDTHKAFVAQIIQDIENESS